MYFLQPAIKRTRHLWEGLLDITFSKSVHHRGHKEYRGNPAEPRILSRATHYRPPPFPMIASYCSFKPLIICELRNVTPAQPQADSSSTPVMGSASILCMKFSPSPISIRNAERGAGYLKPVLWTLILASIVYVAVKVIPVLVNEYEFQDSMQNIARNASANGGTIEKIRDAVLKEAEKDELPVNNEDIKVTAKGGDVRINVSYSVTADLNVYQWTLNFHPAASNDSLV